MFWFLFHIRATMFTSHSFIYVFFILFCLDSFYGYLRLTHFFGHSHTRVLAHKCIWRCSWTVKPGIRFFPCMQRKKNRPCWCCWIKKEDIYRVSIIYKTNLSLIMSTSSRIYWKNFWYFLSFLFLSWKLIFVTASQYKIWHPLTSLLILFTSTKKQAATTVAASNPLSNAFCICYSHCGVRVYRYQLPLVCDIRSHKREDRENKISRNGKNSSTYTQMNHLLWNCYLTDSLRIAHMMFVVYNNTFINN